MLDLLSSTSRLRNDRESYLLSVRESALVIEGWRYRMQVGYSNIGSNCVSVGDGSPAVMAESNVNFMLFLFLNSLRAMKYEGWEDDHFGQTLKSRATLSLFRSRRYHDGRLVLRSYAEIAAIDLIWETLEPDAAIDEMARLDPDSFECAFRLVEQASVHLFRTPLRNYVEHLSSRTGMDPKTYIPVRDFNDRGDVSFPLSRLALDYLIDLYTDLLGVDELL